MLLTGAWTSVSFQVSSAPTVLVLPGVGRSLALVKEVCGKKSSQNLLEIARAANEASRHFDLSEELLVAMMSVESSCKVGARSGKGAIGLMQMMPGTAKQMGVEDPRRLRANVFGGAKYLAGLLDEFKGDVKLAVAAYNAGPAAVKKYKGQPPYRETKHYVKGVLSRYQALKNYKTTESLAEERIDV